IPPEFSDTSSVIINEVLSANTRTVADPQGDFDDYIELHNTSDAPINLSGRYLTDSKSRLRKWAFPEGTIIAGGGYLLIWADEDGKSPDGHHASFKLSRKGETVFLVDSDRNENLVLDSLKFPVQRADVAYGRGATGQLEPLTPTPGKQNTTR
ncbi:MAG: lamin tail domain-containing protein, partial [Planctomycetaceae bacterium]